MNPPKRKNTFMDKFVGKISKNDDDRSTTDDQISTPTQVAPSKLQVGTFIRFFPNK